MNTEHRSGFRRLHLVIRGIVQGVGFRFFVERHARRLGLRGWVRNVADGSVEVLAEGPEEALRLLLEQCQQGPRSAHVEKVETQWLPPANDLNDFQILPSAREPVRL